MSLWPSRGEDQAKSDASLSGASPKRAVRPPDEKRRLGSELLVGALSHPQGPAGPGRLTANRLAWQRTPPPLPKEAKWKQLEALSPSQASSRTELGAEATAAFAAHVNRGKASALQAIGVE